MAQQTEKKIGSYQAKKGNPKKISKILKMIKAAKGRGESFVRKG